MLHSFAALMRDLQLTSDNTFLHSALSNRCISMFDCYDATVPALALLDGLEHLPHTLYAIIVDGGEGSCEYSFVLFERFQDGVEEKRQCANKFKNPSQMWCDFIGSNIFSPSLSVRTCYFDVFSSRTGKGIHAGIALLMMQ